MTEKLKSLVGQYEARGKEVQVLLENPALTAQDVEQARALNARMDALQAEIKTLQDADELKNANVRHQEFLNQPHHTLPFPGNGASVVGMTPAGESWVDADGVVAGSGEGLLSEKQAAAVRSSEYAGAFRGYLRRKGDFGRLSSAEYKTLQEGADDQGGFLVPEEMLNRILQKEPTPTRLASLVTNLTTSRDALVMPKINYVTDDLYTTGIRVTWTGEVPVSAPAHRVNEPMFGQFRVPIYTGMMSMPLTNDLVEDSSFPIMSWASDKFRETVGLLQDNMILNGSGIGQPSGILLNPNAVDQPLTVNSGNATSLTADGLQALAWAMPEQYENNLRWVFSKVSTGKTIGTLKDANQRYLWSSLDGSGLLQPPSARPLLGYPVTFSGFMPTVSAGSFPIIFGDLRGYYLVNRTGFSIQILREVYAESNQIVLLGRLRFGGAVAEPWRLRVQKVSA